MSESLQVINEIVPNAEEIQRTLQLLHVPGVVELRALDTPEGTWSGYYDNSQAMTEHAVWLSAKVSVPGTYHTLQDINRSLLARLQNSVKGFTKKGATTEDANVIRYRWFPLDTDPVRAAGISSTDAEKAFALEVIRKIRLFLSAHHIDSILADSGNGYHLLIRIDLPVEQKQLVRDLMICFVQMFSTKEVKVDVKNSNPARIWKLYGTPARKGSNTPERPWRLSRLLDVPVDVEKNPVSEDVLRSLLKEMQAELNNTASAGTATRTAGAPGSTVLTSEMIESEAATLNFKLGKREEYKFEKDKGTGSKWQIDCPFNPDHKSPDAFLGLRSDGAFLFSCSHDSCTSNGTNAFVEKVPGFAFVHNVEPEEDFSEANLEPFPECPIFTGALTNLARKLCPSIPLEFKMWALMTRWGLLRSGLDVLVDEPHLQPRFQTDLIARPSTGKTAAINESRAAMKMVVDMTTSMLGDKIRPFGKVLELASVDSGQFLVDQFYEHWIKTGKPDFDGLACSDPASKIIIDSDEMSGLFEKAKTSGNSKNTLPSEMLRLHTSNKTGNGTKKGGNREVLNANLAILSGATVEGYPKLWIGTGGGGDGLQGRQNLITTNAGKIAARQLPTDGTITEDYKRLARMLKMPAQKIKISPTAWDTLSSWWASVDDTKSINRITDLIKQSLIVLAVTNVPDNYIGTEIEVGVELMREAIEYGKYEVAVRERLNPQDSWSHIQAMENAIVEWGRYNASIKDPKTMTDFRRGIRPERKPGGLGAFKTAWENCTRTGVVKYRQKGQRSGRYSL